MTFEFFLGLVSAIALGVWIGNNHEIAINYGTRILLWLMPKILWIIAIIGLISLLIYIGIDGFTKIFELVGAIIVFIIVILVFSFLDSFQGKNFYKIMTAILVVGLLLIWIFLT